jgi:ABC-type multidrug transport system fused ATPase/permease subunit
MALVSQDVWLFNDTLNANITYGLNREIAQEELVDVVKKARLYDFIMGLPADFNTYIGDRGIRLSGGEKQRVSIARALLKHAEILILDEATSSLDSKTEQLIQESIHEMVRDKTVIAIAHRLSTIKHADKIVVIDNGRHIEKGGLAELLDKKGRFYEYWETQKFY